MLEIKKKTQAVAKMDGEVLRQMIEFCYTATISIDRKYMDDLMAAAKKYRFVSLKSECRKYYESILCATNCLGIAALAKRYKFIPLMELANTMARERFDDVVQCDEFKRLDSQRVIDFLDADDLNITSEEDVFNAVVQWVEFDLGTRKELMENLLKTVRVGHINDLVSSRWDAFAFLIRIEMVNEFA